MGRRSSTGRVDAEAFGTRRLRLELERDGTGGLSAARKRRPRLCRNAARPPHHLHVRLMGRAVVPPLDFMNASDARRHLEVCERTLWIDRQAEAGLRRAGI